MIQKMQKTGPIHFQLGPQNRLVDQMVKCELQANIPDSPTPPPSIRDGSQGLDWANQMFYHGPLLFIFSSLFIF